MFFHAFRVFFFFFVLFGVFVCFLVLFEGFVALKKPYKNNQTPAYWLKTHQKAPKNRRVLVFWGEKRSSEK